MSEKPAHLPYQAPIEAYGNGGFRFAGMSHKGSLLCLPSGIFAWDVRDPSQIDMKCLDPVLAEKGRILFLLLGTGLAQIFPSPAVRGGFAAAGVGLDPMDTGAACRTYNVLLAERRPVAAALIAVE